MALVETKTPPWQQGLSNPRVTAVLSTKVSRPTPALAIVQLQYDQNSNIYRMVLLATLLTEKEKMAIKAGGQIGQVVETENVYRTSSPSIFRQQVHMYTLALTKPYRF